MKGKCKHADGEEGCKIGTLRFFSLLVCDEDWKENCEDYEESED